MRYNWQQKDWPNFRFESGRLEKLLLALAEAEGQLTGLSGALPEGIKEASVIDMMVAEALKSSAIEGEYLSREDVLSSIRNNLGLNRFPERVRDKRAEGIARLMVEVREHFADKLTEEMLFSWHRMMMEPFANIQPGQWRTGAEPMQVISGKLGKEIVHFEAPPSERVPMEMTHFIDWFNRTVPNQDQEIIHVPIRAAIAHLYFESIHPFEDGNGRIGRAIAEKVLSQGSGKGVLFSLSHAIESDRHAYYAALKGAQSSNEITDWLQFFLQTILNARQIAIRQIHFTIKKAHYFDHFPNQFNTRQEKALNRMFEAGPDGFDGGMNARKYVAITQTSKATATRDLQELLKMGALKVIGGGRSTRYELNIDLG
ncbi:MAG: Fic family protein [Bacteroidota bacterium]